MWYIKLKFEGGMSCVFRIRGVNWSTCIR